MAANTTQSSDEIAYTRNVLTGTLSAQHHHHLSSSASSSASSPFKWQASAGNATRVRAFDLGTDGLKTCLFDVRSDGSLDPMPVEGSLKHLGHAPGEVGGVAHRRVQTVAAWLRHLVPSLEQEMHSSRVLVGASLGQLKFLWKDQVLRGSESFAQLIGMPPTHAIHCSSDANAHLLASKSLIVGAPLCCIAIGAGVSLTMTNAHGEARFDEEMAELFKKKKEDGGGPRRFADFTIDPGDGEPRTALEVFGGAFEGSIHSDNPCASSERQALRWYAFLTRDLPDLCEVMLWPPPRVFAFSGGVVENSDIVHRLRALGVYATLGPPEAGLVGAALRSMDH